MTQVKICETREVPENGIKQISLPGYEQEFAVYHLDGEYFVTDDMCTHGMVSLSGGDIQDGQIFCPLHGGAFDIRTGKATELPCRIRLAVYPVEVKDAVVFADLG